MPDKDGDDEKTTKGVVKKKQKQMMGEEGYDTYRDNILMRGGDHRSKETKEKSYTPSKQPKGQTAAQKAAKGRSALEIVTADIIKRHGKGAIMDVKKKSKKKANEELDLTKIAEAFGGYIIEISDEKLKQAQDKASKQGKKDQAQRIQRSREERFDKELRGVGKVPTRSAFANQPKSKAFRQVVKQARRARPDLFGDTDAELTNRGFTRTTPSDSARMMSRKIPVTDKKTPAPAIDFDQSARNLAAFTGRISGDISADELDRQIIAGRKQERRKIKNIRQLIDPKRRFFTDKPDSETLRTPKTDDEGQFLDKEGKPAPKKLKPATRRKSTATPPAFATRKGESGQPLPVDMRNVRVPKTSSLSPNVKVTSIVKPTVGSLARTDEETSAITKGGIDYKALQDKIKTVSLGKGMEVVDEPKTRTKGGRIGQDTGRTVDVKDLGFDTEVVDQQKPRKKGGTIGKDTGRTVDTTAFEVQPDQLTGSKPRQRALLEPPKGVDPYELLKLKNFKTTETKPEPQPEPEKERRSETIRSNPTDRSGNKPPRKPPRVTTGRGGKGKPFKDFTTSLVSLVRDNPVASLITYDQLKGGQNPFAIRGGRVGSRSAPS